MSNQNSTLEVESMTDELEQKFTKNKTTALKTQNPDAELDKEIEEIEFELLNEDSKLSKEDQEFCDDLRRMVRTL